MFILIVILAFILAWFFIEITLFIVNIKYKVSNYSKKISYKNFIWILRILAISLIFVTVIYMYFFQNAALLLAIEYCLGIINE